MNYYYKSANQCNSYSC